MTEPIYYQKIGPRRYQELPYWTFTGWPADGIWLVRRSRQSLIIRAEPALQAEFSGRFSIADGIYIKKRDRYLLIGRKWRGFGGEGVYEVTDGRWNAMLRLGDVPDPMPVAALERHRDAIGNAALEIMNGWRDGVPTSPNDVADAIIAAVARSIAEQQQRG
jgi:hypothetical protein